MADMMPIADDVHLGQKPLDLEHQGQIELLLAIEAELLASADTARLAMLLDRLIEFTSIHFMSEQALMRELAYSGLPDHAAEHDQLMEQMRHFQQRVESGHQRLSAPHVATLRDWVVRHIHSQDAVFAEFLAENA